MSTAQLDKNNDTLAMANVMTFASLFRAYIECSDEIQEGIRDMVAIIGDPSADEQEKAMALHTLADALFPNPHEGVLGIDLHEAEELGSSHSAETAATLEEMDVEEARFADRLRAAMEKKGVTQEQLAKAVQVGQPAIAMMLARDCRPQRRTVTKLAAALELAPEELWPRIKVD